MTQAVTLSPRIKYITDTDDEGPVGVLVLLGETEDQTVVKEVKSTKDFHRVYKHLRNVEVLDELRRWHSGTIAITSTWLFLPGGEGLQSST